MIKQQINLHQPIFRQQRAVFSSLLMVRACLVWALVLGVFYGLNLLRDRSLAGELAGLVRDRDATAARLQAFAALQDQPDRRQEQEAELARLQGELAQKQGVLRVLARGDLGDSTGFTPQIEALAERRLEGVWLTYVGLSAGDHQVSLRGQALAEELLPTYLEHLAGEQGLPGARFADLRLRRAEDGSSVAFELHSRVAGDRP